jgi:uncharacterized protein (UPF0216 family)
MRTIFIILLIIFLLSIGFILFKKFNSTYPTSVDKNRNSEESQTSAHLIFKSSFDEKTSLSKPDRKDSEIWWQDMKSSKGDIYNWPEKKGKASFQMIINKNDINNYIENRIESTIGINDKKTKALHQIIKKKEHEWTQVPFLIETDDKEQQQLYIRYSLKLPKNLADILGKDGWLVLSEYKTISDYRLALYIYTDENKRLYWYAHGDNVVLDDIPYKEYWYRENREVNVPVGEWMDIEIFWKRSKGKDGRVWLTVDGKNVIDYHGTTKLVDPIRIIMIFTNYANSPLDQWIDNVEVWDDFPCGSGKSCHKIK